MSKTQRNAFALQDLATLTTDRLQGAMARYEATIETLAAHEGPVLRGLREEVREALAEIQQELTRRANTQPRNAIRIAS